jgi:hypothetical protein
MSLYWNRLSERSNMCFKQLFQGKMAKEYDIELPLCCKHMASGLNIIS